jgi:type I restriction enzyme S subunit
MNQSYRSSYGICDDQLSLRFNDFKRIYSLVPPPEEQAAIVAFIEYKSEEINNVVTAKKRIISLLREQKTALINRAVTQGLDASTPCRASGIDWLGDVPVHWEVKKLKYLTRLNPSRKRFFEADETCVFLPMESVSTEGRILHQQYRLVNEVREGFTYFERGDVVMAKITPCFENGKGAYLKELETDFGFGTTEFIVLRANKKILPNFLHLVTVCEAFRSQGEEFMTGSAGQKRVPTSFVSNFSIGLPPISEQAAIVEHIERETQLIETTIATAEREIELMQELKTSLIASAVTGQIDVRDYQVPHIEYSNQAAIIAHDAAPDVLDERLETV